jgi:hypothetical protein
MEDMANAGATVLDQPVVVDENVITSRFIYDIPQFVDAIVAQPSSSFSTGCPTIPSVSTSITAKSTGR